MTTSATDWRPTFLAKSRSRTLTRRTLVLTGLGALAAMPLAAACGQPSTTAKPAADPAATTAPAAPAAAAKPTEAPKPAAPAAAAKPDAKPAAAAPAGGRPEPKAPAFQAAKITGKLAVVQSRDFHPDHNTFVEKK